MAKVIIIADDSRTVQKVVDLILSPHGYIVKAFDNGKDVLKFLEENGANLILADTNMPNVNGFELGISLKESNISSVPLLLIFGDFTQMDSEKYLASGAVGRLEKPFDAKQLISVVKKYSTDELTATVKDEKWSMDSFDGPIIPNKNLDEEYELEAINSSNKEEETKFDVENEAVDEDLVKLQEYKEELSENDIDTFNEYTEINSDSVFEELEANENIDHKESSSNIDKTTVSEFLNIDNEENEDDDFTFLDELEDEEKGLDLKSSDNFIDDNVQEESEDKKIFVNKVTNDEANNNIFITKIFEETDEDISRLNEDNLPPEEVKKLFKEYKILEKEDGSIQFSDDEDAYLKGYEENNFVEKTKIDVKFEETPKEDIKDYNFLEVNENYENEIIETTKEALWESRLYNEELVVEKLSSTVSTELKNDVQSLVLSEIKKILPDIVEKIAREELAKILEEEK